jgi:limonene-1,2-epoxide hydrolase
MEPLDVVTRFCAAWQDVDLDEILSFLGDDAVYHNIPLDPVTGKDAIRATIAGFTAGVERIEFDVLHIAVTSAGNVVLTERVDRFVTPDRTIALPVMGTFELAGDGTITAWRDYFDLNQFMTQLTPA